MFSFGNVVINRCGCDIILPKKMYKDLQEEGYTLSVVKHNKKPSSVQVMKAGKYVGTLKSLYGIESFKDGNVCNFKKRNLVF